MDNLMIRISQCCRPIPGDPIVGFITRGRGVTVHRRDCPNTENLISEEGRRIDVEWDSDKEQTFIARILVLADDRKNLLNDVTKVIGRMGMNIRNAQAAANLGVAENEFELDVRDLKELDKLMEKLKRVKGMRTVERLDRPLDGEPISLPEFRVRP
jgi:GTP pyrophosphokinase